MLLMICIVETVETLLIVLIVLGLETIETCAIGLLRPYTPLSLSAPGSLRGSNIYTLLKEEIDIY